MNAIIIGYEGKVDMFCAIGYLSPIEQPEALQEQAPLPKMNPKLFQAMFGRG